MGRISTNKLFSWVELKVAGGGGGPCIGRGGAKERFQLQDILVGLNQRLNHERWLKSRPSSIAAVCLPIMLELVLFMRMKSVPIKFRSFLPTIDARSAGFRCIMAAGKAGLILREM